MLQNITTAESALENEWNHLLPVNQQVCAWLATSVKGIRKGSSWIPYVVPKSHLPWSPTTHPATFKQWNLRKLVRKTMVVTPLAKTLTVKEHQNFHIKGLSFQSHRWPLKSQGDRYPLKKEKIKRLKIKSTEILWQNESASFSLSSDIINCGGRVEHRLNAGLL